MVFLDRDGVINVIKENEYVTSSEQLILIEGVSEAIRLIREKGYFIIIVTNQPVVARGDVSISDLNHIHSRLEFFWD